MVEKIKILILSANPKETDALRLGEEVREIESAMERARSRDQFEIITKSAVRVDDLRRSLLDHEPQIVHFSGHGAGANGLVLENNAGKMQLVSTESLARLFKAFRSTVNCVCLNACYSEVQAEAIHQHIAHVVGMNQAIGDRAAIEFAKGFYDALGAGLKMLGDPCGNGKADRPLSCSHLGLNMRSAEGKGGRSHFDYFINDRTLSYSDVSRGNS